MTTTFVSTGLNSTTMEADTVVQIPGSYGLLSITGYETMQIKHNAHKQDVFYQLHSKSYFQLQSFNYCFSLELR